MVSHSWLSSSWLDSATAHDRIDMRDPEKEIPWRHLRIQRLPKYSTSITQPLDASVIRIFKRAFLEMLGYEPYFARNFDKANCISNSRAWTPIPYPWDQIKPVLPLKMREEFRQRSSTRDELKPNLQYTRHKKYKRQMKMYFQNFIAQKMRMGQPKEAAHRIALQQNEQGSSSEEEVGCGVSLSHDRSTSSPADDIDFNATIQTLKDLAGDHKVLTIDSL
ncbi:hypothetical protein BX616_005312 [Lobosporangium transversale]|nr:hypothetical protein BX616_005312 [Lobosporangium transversale]